MASQPLITKEQAESLAVSYHAFMVANCSDPQDYNGTIVWGRILIEAQAAIGVFLQDPDRIARLIAYAEQASCAKQEAA